MLSEISIFESFLFPDEGRNKGRGRTGGGQNKKTRRQELSDVACDGAEEITCTNSEYRTVTGICNNLGHPTWGAASIAMRRYVPAQYADSDGTPRGGQSSSAGHSSTGGKPDPWYCPSNPKALLPNARRVSSQFHTNATVDDSVFTHMITQMGQFLDHDITFTPEAEHECCGGEEERTTGLLRHGGSSGSIQENTADCFPIGIPCEETHFTEVYLHSEGTARYGSGKPTTGPSYEDPSLEFIRSLAFCDGNTPMREQVNGITAFVDASNVYGSTVEVNEALRDLSTGKMLVDANDLLPEVEGSRMAGDVRALEMPGLAAMHTIFVREHNRIAQHFIDNGSFSAEDVYLKTRRIVSAQMQNIVYGQYLTGVLGQNTMANDDIALASGVQSTYDSSVDPSIFNAFATVAYRFGHAKITGLIQMISTTTGAVTSYNLRDAFFELTNYLQNNGDGMEQILSGLIQQASLKNDRFVTKDVTDFLFANNGHPGSDLIARNIQRGRDHGIPGYNDFRDYCGLPRACSWDQAPSEISSADWTLLSTLYDDPSDIDLFAAGMAETPHDGGIVGRTFNCLLSRQFKVTNVTSMKATGIRPTYLALRLALKILSFW